MVGIATGQGGWDCSKGRDVALLSDQSVKAKAGSGWIWGGLDPRRPSQ